MGGTATSLSRHHRLPTNPMDLDGLKSRLQGKSPALNMARAPDTPDMCAMSHNIYFACNTELGCDRTMLAFKNHTDIGYSYRTIQFFPTCAI